MTKLEIIELIALGLFILVLVIYYLIKAIKNKWLSQLSSTIVDAMRFAETHFANGADKKKHVMLQVEQLCKDLDIPYVFMKNLIDKYIEKVIDGHNKMIKGGK